MATHPPNRHPNDVRENKIGKGSDFPDSEMTYEGRRARKIAGHEDGRKSPETCASITMKAIASGPAWLVIAHRSPGRDALVWLLPLPLAVPTYIQGLCLPAQIGRLPHASLRPYSRALEEPSARRSDCIAAPMSGK
jgi:hypothetical protein